MIVLSALLDTMALATGVQKICKIVEYLVQFTRFRFRFKLFVKLTLEVTVKSFKHFKCW